MKLYHHPISTNCRRVLATIYENGRDDVELQHVDLMAGEHQKPEFLAINPNGKVPALVDGELRLWESMAIMQYLSSDSPLWPPSKARYDIVRWQCWTLAHWGPGINKVVYERMIKKAVGAGDPDEQVIAEGLELFQRYAKVLDDHLNGRDWLVGDSITLAEYAVAADLTYVGAVGIDVSPFPNVTRWYSQIEERDAWKKSAPPALTQG